ncbi:hypothetical protein DSCA_10010 [Desulfosarcina alkanivorans]|uniref:Uncharacterized protein n=1 Tax=Desulfosarcina alkanivorans TaxID=571177 RepID=A0A5K7YJV6_9BACT|nr:hypothetical protein DSCA_10010 [Desulfosarcina alkanivorans]
MILIVWPTSRKKTPNDASNQANPKETKIKGEKTIGTKRIVQWRKPLSRMNAPKRTIKLTIVLNNAEHIATTGSISSGKTTFFT